jgi:uncharacterized membrane protein YhiD involved in acid resistance
VFHSGVGIACLAGRYVTACVVVIAIAIVVITAGQGARKTTTATRHPGHTVVLTCNIKAPPLPLCHSPRDESVTVPFMHMQEHSYLSTDRCVIRYRVRAFPLPSHAARPILVRF